jgi:hypothetical protein
MAHFKLETELSGFMCSFDEGQSLDFHYKSPAPVLVSIKPRGRNGEALCTALIFRDLKPEVNLEIRQSMDGDALLRVAPLLPSPTLRAVPEVMPGRDGKAGSLIELES